MKPRILVACEYSGRVRDEFAARGWDAWSCDFEPSDTVGQHYRGDVRDLLKQHWDMLIAFPPCTYLCGSGRMSVGISGGRFLSQRQVRLLASSPN